MRLFVCTLCVCAMLVLAPRLCGAEVERFAILAGNNSGAPDEADLRFAESDTQKVYDVLLDLGGFRSENVVLLRGRDAEAMRRALIAVNQRIRSSVAAGRDVMLLVYYSGHGDERALHLGRSELPLVELEQLVSGSAAQFRLLIVDACRSGTLTQGKGGKSAPAFAITLDDRLAGEGAVYLTASAATEDAQESLQLQGSFFTHYLISGMLGAADGNGDGQVVLSEAYRYAYDHTLRASSRTLAGMQHPSFRYDLSGQGDVVLSWPRADARQRAQVQFPPGRTYLVFQGSADGPVVAEVGFADRRRTLSLRPGRYFVRGRDRRYLLEGTIELTAGQTSMVSDGDLARIDYARLVRKGGGTLRSVAAVMAGYHMRSAIHSGESLCHGAFAGYRIDYEYFAVVARLGGCRAGFANTYLEATNDELDASARLLHSWDLPWALSLDVGVGIGASLLRQTFLTRGNAPDRVSGAGHVSAAAGLSIALGSGFLASIDVAAQTYFFRVEDETDAEGFEARLAIRGLAAFGRHF